MRVATSSEDQRDDIEVTVNLDGRRVEVATGIAFSTNA